MPNPWRSVLSASSARFGGGEDVGERLADVGEPGGAEVPDVGEKARRAEPAGQRHRGAHGQRGGPQRHDGVAVEERHGAVADVVALEPVDLADARPAMAARRPWVQRTALGSPVVPDVKSSRRRSSGATSPDGPDARRGRRRGSIDAGRGTRRSSTRRMRSIGDVEVEALEEPGARVVGHEELAVGEADVAGQLLAPPGGVDPDHGRPGQGGGSQPEQVLRHVVEQDPDVGRLEVVP